jgi:hypothetical protein
MGMDGEVSKEPDGLRGEVGVLLEPEYRLRTAGLKLKGGRGFGEAVDEGRGNCDIRLVAGDGWVETEGKEGDDAMNPVWFCTGNDHKKKREKFTRNQDGYRCRDGVAG